MFKGYTDDDREKDSENGRKGKASAACACEMGNFGQPHTGDDCGTYRLCVLS
jgi:hypothetical protein